MAKVHGKVTFVSLDGVDLSTYCNNHEFTLTSDSHDVTTFGKDAHVKQGGLLDGTATLAGFYDSTAVSGPRAAIQPLRGTVVPLIRRPEGTGAGLPEDTVDVLVQEYMETSPVADMVTWSVSLELSDDVVSIAQV